jgi:hypothetical protein
MQPSNLELNYTSPIVASDGNTIFITEEGPATLVFFQVRKQTPGAVEADAVAAVRFHNLNELKQLQKNITDTIAKHESREK